MGNCGCRDVMNQEIYCLLFALVRLLAPPIVMYPDNFVHPELQHDHKCLKPCIEMLVLYLPKPTPTHSYVPTYLLSLPLPQFPSYFTWAAALSLGTNSFIRHLHPPFLTTVCLLVLIGGVRRFVLINSVFGMGLGFILMLFPTSTFCSRNLTFLLVYKLIVANLPINFDPMRSVCQMAH